MNIKSGMEPERLNELFEQVCRDHQDGKLADARRGYSYLLSLFPEAPVLHYNNGLVLLELDRHEDAREAFLKAAELQPDDPDTLFNLAIAEKKIGNIGNAVEIYQRILIMAPGHIDAWYNLGACYRELHEFGSAEKVYLEILRQDAEHTGAMSNIAFVYASMHEHDKAVQYFRRLLELRPDDQSARHMIAALSGENVTSMPADYVQSIFDNLADNFEEKLQDILNYQAPEKIRVMVQSMLGDEVSFTYGLDVGCGTGLGAEALVELVKNFDGIDLSPEMIEIADQKKLYRNLFTGNFLEVLSSSSKDYDFILAADVFAYLGDLAPALGMLRGSGRAGTILCFTTETKEQGGEGFRLRKSGRFAHGPQYVVDCAGQHGWKLIQTEQTQLRKEKGAWIQGDLWLFQAVR